MPGLTSWLNRADRGRILAVRWGLNPNSSALGVDVTLLLVGSVAIALLTPIVGVLVRVFARRPAAAAAEPAGGRREGE
jgi:hypothetical protein